MKTLSKLDKKVIQHGLDNLEGVSPDIIGCDLHSKLYNEDYFIIGYYEAEQFLNKVGVFKAIEMIKQYEQDNFGEVNTDFSDSEKVANMYAYIVGEEVLQESETLKNKWDDRLNQSDIDAIKLELEELL